MLPSRKSVKIIARAIFAAAIGLALPAGVACAGPPYISDDPQPTDYQHFEIYTYTDGSSAPDGTSGNVGIDFNYGAAPDLQLTAVVPMGYESPAGAPTATGLSNIELAAKYRFLHQDDFGLDVAVFPRVILPSPSSVGKHHAALLLPIWMEKDWGAWSTFGGGGCEIRHGARARDFCQVGWVLARRILPDLQIGAEVTYQTADVKGGVPTTSVGAGVIYDLSENYHLMAYIGPNLENPTESEQRSWYAAIQFTF